MSKRRNKKDRELDVVIKLIALLTVALDLITRLLDLIGKLIK